MEGDTESGQEVGLSSGDSAVFPLAADPAPPPPNRPPEGSGPVECGRDWRHSSAIYIAIGVAGAVGVFFALGAAGAYSIPFIIQNLPSGFGPLEISLEFTTYTYIIGFGIALGLGLVRAYPPRRDPTVSRKRLRTRLSWLWRWPLYAFTSGYVAAIRGTPFLVQLFIVWNVMIFTVPHLLFLGWDVNYWAGFIALLINTAGYQVEVFRGGFQSVGAGQIEGAKAVGLSRVQTFFRVTLPQTIRLMSLPLTNEWISNFKTATILSFIGVFEVYDWAHTNIALYDAQPIAAFVMLCIFYVGVNVTLSRVVTYIERVRRIPGLGSPDLNVDMSKRLIGVDVRGSRPGSKPRGSPGSAAPQLASRAHPAALERSSR